MSSRPHPGSERPLHGPLQRFDLGAEVGGVSDGGGSLAERAAQLHHPA
jgi:hypothetical protein